MHSVYADGGLDRHCKARSIQRPVEALHSKEFTIPIAATFIGFSTRADQAATSGSISKLVFTVLLLEIRALARSHWIA